MRKTAAINLVGMFLFVLLLQGCRDFVGPTIENRPRDIIPHQVPELLTLAAKKLGVARRSHVIGVLDRARTDSTALVTLTLRNVTSLYRFKRVNGRWVKADLIKEEPRSIQPATRPSDGDQSDIIGIIRYGDGTIVDLFHYNDVGATESGWYRVGRQYPNNLAWSGHFQEGTHVSGDTVFEASFPDGAYWFAKIWANGEILRHGRHRINASLEFRYEDDNGLLQVTGAEYAEIYFHMEVTPPLSVTIDGPALVSAGTTETWTALVSGETAPISYQWYRDGALVSEESSYTANVGTADFQLRVEASDANGDHASDVITVNVGDNDFEYDPPSDDCPGSKIIC